MWESFIIQPMVNLLLWIYDILGHGPQMFGLAIILFTIVIRLITWPLNASQVKGAQAMQELNSDKEWQDIQKKYAKDREKLAQERSVPFLGRVPLDAEVRKGGDYGRPIVVTEPDNPAGQAFAKLAQTVAARVSVVMLQTSDVIPLTIIG